MLLLLRPVLDAVLMAVSARLAGWYLGEDPLFGEGAWWISGTDPILIISAACSGSTFFILWMGLGVWLIGTEAGGGGWIIPLAWLFPGSIALVSAVNATRILMSHQMFRLTADRLDPLWLDRVHVLAGVVTFLPALIGLYTLTRWRLTHERAD